MLPLKETIRSISISMNITLDVDLMFTVGPDQLDHVTEELDRFLIILISNHLTDHLKEYVFIAIDCFKTIP
jgi:hypothetical protein